MLFYIHVDACLTFVLQLESNPRYLHVLKSRSIAFDTAHGGSVKSEAHLPCCERYVEGKK